MFRLFAKLPTRWMILFAVATWACPTRADVLSMGVDASLKTPMKVIAAEYEKASGHQTAIYYASTGRLYQRLKTIAPFQIVLTADLTTAKRLEEERMAIEGSRFKFAAGRLAFWAAKENLIDGSGGLVGDPALMKLAMSNAQVSTYGAAAQAAIKKLPRLQNKGIRVVRDDDESVVIETIRRGKADIGFVALADVFENGKIAQGYGWIVPDSVVPPVPHEAVLLDKQVLTDAAKGFIEFLKSPRAREILRAHGLDA